MRKRPLCFICILFLVIQTLRVCLFGAGTREVSELEEALDAGSYVTVTGTVSGIEEKKSVTAVFLKDTAVSLSYQRFSEPNLMVYVRPDDRSEQSGMEMRIGNQVQISGEAELFDEARNPGNFDQSAYYARQRIYFLVWADEGKILSHRTDRVREFLSQVRSAWKERLIRHLGEYYGGTMSAILLGDKSSLDAEMKKQYQKNGIGHLLAISGLHMTFLGMGLYNLLRRAGLGFAAAGSAGAAVLICYSLMIGAGVSSLRALIMFLVRIGAEIAGRDYDLMTSLFLSAAILCAWQPLYLTDAGFLLSYGAILGIALFSPVFEDLFCIKGKGAGSKVLKWCLEGLAGSLAVNVMLLGPILSFYFEIPPYSVFLNLLVIPVMPAVMGAGVIGSGLAVLSDAAGGTVMQVCRGVLWLYDRLCGWAGALPGGRFVAGRPEAAWIAVYYVILGGICVSYYWFVKRKEREEEKGDERQTALIFWKRICRLPGLAMLLFAVGMTLLCRLRHQTGNLQVTVLDVGQGDGIHIREGAFNCMIDGGSSDVSSVGTYRLEPYFLSQGVRSLDYVFITHGDEDHISGVREMLQNQSLGVEIHRLVLPPEEYHDEKLKELAGTAQENGTKVVTIGAGQEIKEENELILSCLGPEEDLRIEPGNAASLVLSLSYGDFDMLLTGDVEGKGEEALVESGHLKKYDVLKAAHHGSRNSGLEQFLEIVQPSVALVSAGADNRYGHPHEETLKRLDAAGCSVYSTQDNGAITVWTDGEKMRIEGTVTK